jgi:hypothetical protein
MEDISVCTFSPSSINSGTIKSLGVKIVSATMLRIAGVVLKILFLLGKYILENLNHKVTKGGNCERLHVP